MNPAEGAHLTIRRRTETDLPQVLSLLVAESLPPDGLDLTEGWVAEEQGRIVAQVAVEKTADAAVLRSEGAGAWMRRPGFQQVSVIGESAYDPGETGAAASVANLQVSARKPGIQPSGA